MSKAVEMYATPGFNSWLSRLCGDDFVARVNLFHRVKGNIARAYDAEYIGAG